MCLISKAGQQLLEGYQEVHQDVDLELGLHTRTNSQKFFLNFDLTQGENHHQKKGGKKEDL